MTPTLNTSSCNSKYTDKLLCNATALSSLFLLPAISQAAIIHNTSSISLSSNDALAVLPAGSPTNPSTSVTVTVDWDIDGNLVADLQLAAYAFSVYTESISKFVALELSPTESAIANTRYLKFRGGLNLPGEATVGSTPVPEFQWEDWGFGIYTSSNGQPFSGPKDFLIGFSFIGDLQQVLYGWAQINTSNAPSAITISQWAYEDSGDSIQVGQISSVPLPQSAFLMLSGLAMGAGGILRGRKARKAALKKSTEVAPHSTS